MHVGNIANTGALRLVASMSRKGNCYDNAAMEAFWSTLKREALEKSANWFKDRVRCVISNTSNPFTTGAGSTALWSTNHLWSSNTRTTKNEKDHKQGRNGAKRCIIAIFLTL